MSLIMDLPIRPSNDPLSAAQITMVSENIASRRKDLKYTEKIIQQEETKSAAAIAAIAHLEPAISRAKLAMAVHKDTTLQLTKLKANLEEIIGSTGPNWEDSSKAEELCKNAMAIVDKNTHDEMNSIISQISRMEADVPKLSATVQEMELELYSQMLVKYASLQYTSDLGARKQAIEENIKVLRLGLDPIKNTPAETWVKIMALRVSHDLEIFFSNPTSPVMTYTTLKLSQVCRFWRRIVFNERKLWEFIAIYGHGVWLPSKVELFKHYMSFNRKNPHLVQNLTQLTTWTKIPQFDWRGKYTHSEHKPTVSLQVGDIPMHNRYSLTILADGNKSTYNTNSINFRQPNSLTLQFLSNVDDQWLDSLFKIFSGLKTLEIVVRGEYRSTPQQFATTQPELNHLRLDLNTFQPFEISGYLGPNLTELHLMHNGTNTLAQSPTTLRLPKLKILGITPPDTTFIRSLELPALTGIVLYGPKDEALSVISLVDFADSPCIARACHLELRNWPLYKPGAGLQWSVTVVLNSIVEKLSSFTTLRCVDSYIPGNGIVRLVSALKDADGDAQRSMLERVLIDTCSGITRENCASLRALVRSVEVYV